MKYHQVEIVLMVDYIRLNLSQVFILMVFSTFLGIISSVKKPKLRKRLEIYLVLL